MGNPIARLRPWQQIVFFVFVVGTALALYDWLKSRPVNDIADAKSKMVGVWTYTRPINPTKDTFPFEWMKWDIRADGKVVLYNAKPVDGSWGEGETMDYAIVSEKYTDTGERWFGIKPKNSAMFAVLEDGKLTVYLQPAYSTSGRMERGDNHPFSK